MKEGLSKSLAKDIGLNEKTLFCCRLSAYGTSVGVFTNIPELQDALGTNLKVFVDMIPGFKLDSTNESAELGPPKNGPLFVININTVSMN